MSNNYVNKYADFISQENLKGSKKTMSKDDIATLEALGHVHEAELAAAETELEEAFADIHEAISNSLLEDYDVSDITEEEFDDYVLDVIAEMVENSDELLESEDLQENAGLAVLRFLAKAFKAPIAANKFRKEVSDKIGKMAADKLKLTPAALGVGVSIGREIDKREIDKKINKKSKGPHTEEYGDDAPKAKRGRPSKDEGDVEHPFQQVRTAHTKGRVQGDHIRITHPSTNANKMIHKDDVKAYYNKYVNSQKPAQKEQCTSDFLAKHFGAGMTRAQMLKHY